MRQGTALLAANRRAGPVSLGVVGGDLVTMVVDLVLDHLDDVDLAHVGRDLPSPPPPHRPATQSARAPRRRAGWGEVLGDATPRGYPGYPYIYINITYPGRRDAGE